jgi:hypothetical protein
MEADDPEPSVTNEGHSSGKGQVDSEYGEEHAYEDGEGEYGDTGEVPRHVSIGVCLTVQSYFKSRTTQLARKTSSPLTVTLKDSLPTETSTHLNSQTDTVLLPSGAPSLNWLSR